MLLTELHLRFHGYGQPGTSAWTDSAVRRYVTDAGDQLSRLHKLVRSDCTTRNRRRAAALAGGLRRPRARASPSWPSRRSWGGSGPTSTGDDIMELLGVPPGPVVGQAYKHLLALRMERGPLPREQAEAELRAWARRAGPARRWGRS